MYIRFVFFYMILAGLVSSSCSSIYTPNVPATPMFQGKGEIHVAAHSNSKGNLSGNVGAAIGDHIAVLANGSYLNQGTNNSRNELFRQHLIEGGVGYFTRFGKGKRQIVEIYAGYGIGSSTAVERRASTTGMATVETREMDFDKFFVQVNYSFTQKKRLRFLGKQREINYGTAIRASRIAMQNFTINAVNSQKEEGVFIEPLFYTRMELNRSFQLQYTNGFNFNLMDNNYLKAGNAVFTLGITYRFARNNNK